MKSDNPAVTPLPVDPERSQLDWPFHAGLVDQVMEKVRVKVKRRQARRRRLASGAAALALVAFAVLWGVPYYRETATVATVTASRQTLTLSDGSRADLNAQTRMRTDFRYGRRLVRLDRGEAFFSVAKDAAHPFLVETPAGIVRVTGTQFNVRLTEGGAAEVTLLEGAVEFEGGDPAAPRAALTPGQQLDSSRTDLRRLSDADMENVTAWREGRLALDGLTLADAAARLAAYHGKGIAIADEVKALRPGGSVPLDDLSGALEALQDTLPIRVLPAGDGSLRIVRR